jgi:hypothetical protein
MMSDSMACPICQKRKPQRFCPARGDEICSVCCGREREVTIDCPSDCPYLVASRSYDLERRKIDWSKLPFPEVKIHPSYARAHGRLLGAINYAICAFARDERSTADTDVLSSLQALAESYRTLSSGIYYEKLPEHRLQRALYEHLKAAIEEYKRVEAKETGTSVRDSEFRDALIFFTQLGATYLNGRPKGRAFLDLLRSQIKSEDFSKPQSNIVLLP